MSEQMRRVAIFGGSFDPPHHGHIEVILRLKDIFDKVIVVPASISPFKQNQKTTDKSDRLRMLCLGLAKEKNVDISKFEISKADVTYTYQTIEHFLQEEKECQLYFVVGSENIQTLHLWKNAEFLSKNVIFYVIQRENFCKTTYQNASDIDFKIEVAPFVVKDYSSSLFKVANAFGFALDFVPKSVFDYIIKNNLYNDYKIYVKGLKAANLSKDRIRHTYNAVKMGIILAKTHHEDVDKTIKALLLHDIGKNSTPQSLLNKGIQPSDTSLLPPPCHHAVFSRDIALQHYKIQDNDILNAIFYHTTARPNMSKLEKIVMLSDYLEEGRSFFDKAQILTVAKNNLDKAVLKMLKSKLNYLKESKAEICEITLKAYSFYNE